MKYYLLLFFIAVSGFILASDEFDLIDLTQRSKDFEKTLGEKLGARVVIDGGLVLKILPNPHIEVINFKVFDEDRVLFSTNKIIFYVGLSDIINGISNIDKVTAKVNEASIRTNDINKYLSFTKNKIDVSISIDTADIEFDYNNILQNNISVNNLLLTSNGSDIMNSGSFDFKGQQISYQLTTSNANNISVNLASHGFNFNLLLNSFDKENFSLKSGKVELKINKISSILGLIIDRPYESIGNGSEKAIEYNIEISGDLLSDINNEIRLQNLSVNNNFIDNLDLNFRAYKVMDEIVESYIYLSADKINLRYLKDLIPENTDINDLLRNILSTSKVSKYLNLNLNIDFKKVILSRGQINDFFLSSYHILNRVIIDKVGLSLPGESQVSFKGLVSGNEIRKKINGFIKVSSKDDQSLINWYNGSDEKQTEGTELTFEAKVFGMQNLFKATKYRLKRGSETIAGNAYFYEIPYEVPVKILTIEGININLDTIGFTSEWDIYFKKLYNADSDKSGEDYFRLTNANSWIRSLNKTLYLDLSLKDSIIRDKMIGQLNGLIEIAPSIFDIKNLTIRNDKIDGNLRFKFVLPVLRPQISADLDFRTLDLQYVKDLITPKLDDVTKNNQEINFLSANNYDGHLKFKVNNLIVDETTNPMWLNSEADLKFGYISIPKLQYSLWNGQFDINSQILISSNKPVFKSAFNIYNINPKDFFKKITGVDKISGYMSLAGVLQGDLNNFKKISGDIDFLGAQIIWNGFNLDKVVEIVDGNYTKSSKLQGVEYYSQYGSTTFDILKGKMTIKNGLVNIENANMSDRRLDGLFSVNYDLGSTVLDSAAVFAFIPIRYDQPLTINFKTAGKIAKPTENSVDYKNISNFINSSSQN